jgi:ABC-type multidrug transport system permease subunit
MSAAFCFPAVAVAVACTREVEHGSYEGLLSTPLTVPEYLVGKLLPYLAVGSVGALLSWVLALVWFRVPFRGSLFSYLFLAAVFLLSLMSISILVGSMARNQRHVIIIIVLIYFIPTFFMSGLLTPLESGALSTRVLRLILPAANYVRINRALFLKGMAMSELVPEITSLLRISGVSLVASVVLARRKVA